MRNHKYYGKHGPGPNLSYEQDSKAAKKARLELAAGDLLEACKASNQFLMDHHIAGSDYFRVHPAGVGQGGCECDLAKQWRMNDRAINKAEGVNHDS